MIGEKLKTILDSFNRAFDQLDAALVVVQASEREACPEHFVERYQQELILGESFNFSGQRKKAAQYLFNTLVRKAEKDFGPPGAALTIDKLEVEKHFKLREAEYFETLDLIAVWQHLTDEYGLQGVDLAYTQAADQIVKHFLIRADQPIKTVSGQIVLERVVWIDGFDKKHFKRNNLSHGSREEVFKLCHDLAAFAIWAGDPLLAEELKRFGAHTCNNATLDSRARYPLGSPKCPSVTIVKFTTRFEFRFSAELGLKLQEFLGLYAVKLQEAA